VSRSQAFRQRADNVVWALEQLVKDRSVTAANRTLARRALEDARAIRDRSEPCPGCDEQGRQIRQQPNGDLVCLTCERIVSSAEAPDVQ